MTAHYERVLLATCIAAYFGYYVFADSLMRGWVYYVATGALAAVAGYGWRVHAQTWYGAAATTVMMSEGAQQALCGLATIGVDLSGRDLCKRALGDDLYTGLASLAMAGLMVIAWPILRPQK